MTHRRPQAHFEKAFDNYLELTAVLRDDMAGMLDAETKAPQWRRNFLRTSAALLEGSAHGLRQMCIVGASPAGTNLTSKEMKALKNEAGLSTNERIKYTLRVSYKVFGLNPMPNFSGPDWIRAKKVLNKRHKLMHPTSVQSLGVSDTTWRELKKGTIWLLEQFFGFSELLSKKYVR